MAAKDHERGVDPKAARRLAHAMRNDLFTVSLGIEALAANQDNPELTRRMIEKLRPPLESLRISIDSLGDLAHEQDSAD